MSPALPVRGFGGHAAVLRAMARRVGRVWWLILPVLAVTALATISGKASTVGATFCVAAAIAVYLAWWVAASALMGQNDPLSAHLLPGQLQRLRETAVAVFLALAAVCGLLFHAAFGHGLVFTMGAALFMLAFAACLRWPWLWVVIWFPPWLVLPPLSEIPWALETLDTMTAWHHRQPWTQTAAVLLLLCAGLWGLFQTGGARHVRSWQNGRRFRQLMSTHGGARPVGGSGQRGPRGAMAALGRVFQWAQPLWREHLLRQARPTAASVTARAVFVALRGLHWSALGSTAGLLFLCFLLAEAWLLIYLPDRAGRVIRAAMPGVSIGLMSAMLSPLFGVSATLVQTRREQAILTLLPGMPRGEAMNRALGGRILLQYVGVWTAGLAMILAMSLLAALAPGESVPDDHALLGLHFAAVALPAGLLAWRDWSRQTVPSGARVAMLTMSLLLAMGLGIAATRTWQFSPLWLVGGSVLSTAAVAAWRWRALPRLAPFWPVGRHAVE